VVVAEAEVADLLAYSAEPALGVDGFFALGPHEHQSERFLDRHGDQTETVTVEAGEAVVAVRRGDELAFEVVGPSVEPATKAASPLSG
jgi:hypothetical protein